MKFGDRIKHKYWGWLGTVMAVGEMGKQTLITWDHDLKYCWPPSLFACGSSWTRNDRIEKI